MRRRGSYHASGYRGGTLAPCPTSLRNPENSFIGDLTAPFPQQVRGAPLRHAPRVTTAVANAAPTESYRVDLLSGFDFDLDFGFASLLNRIGFDLHFDIRWGCSLCATLAADSALAFHSC